MQTGLFPFVLFGQVYISLESCDLPDCRDARFAQQLLTASQGTPLAPGGQEDISWVPCQRNCTLPGRRTEDDGNGPLASRLHSCIDCIWFFRTQQQASFPNGAICIFIYCVYIGF